ncbi:MAG: TolC family protein [Deltaproteobacteria bacterium]|nr:TolC family protein [Deltaproteobacteria bacterium]
MKRTIPAVLLAFSVFLPALSSAAAEGPSLEELEARLVSGPSQGDLVAYAYRASPMVRSAHAMWEATAEKYRVATGHPDPRIMVEGMFMTEELRGTPDDWKVTLSQMIPLPGRLGAEGAVVRAEARAARYDLDKAVRDVVVQVRESFQELLYLAEATRIAAQNKDLLDQLRKVAESAYAGNRALLYDVAKAQAQAGQLQYDVLLLRELEQTEKARLNGLLSRAPEAPLGPLAAHDAQPLAFELGEIYRMAEANREEIKAAQARSERAEAMLSTARYENLPEVELGASVGRQLERDQIGIQAGLTLPLWPGKRAGRVGQARAELESARAMKVAEVNDARTQVRESYFRLRNSERLVALYRGDLLPQAAKAMETAETWYREGQGSFADYVEAQAVWYNFQLSLARAKADQGKFLARLEALAGQSLTRKAESPPPDPAGGEQRGEGAR